MKKSLSFCERFQFFKSLLCGWRVNHWRRPGVTEVYRPIVILLSLAGSCVISECGYVFAECSASEESGEVVKLDQCNLASASTMKDFGKPISSNVELLPSVAIDSEEVPSKESDYPSDGSGESLALQDRIDKFFYTVWLHVIIFVVFFILGALPFSQQNNKNK